MSISRTIIFTHTYKGKKRNKYNEKIVLMTMVSDKKNLMYRKINMQAIRINLKSEDQIRFRHLVLRHILKKN